MSPAVSPLYVSLAELFSHCLTQYPSLACVPRNTTGLRTQRLFTKEGEKLGSEDAVLL